MKTMSHLNLSFFLFLFLILSLSFFASSSSSSNNPDVSALQSFKSSSDPLGLLASWDPATDPCSGSWFGVSCSNGRITRIVLEGLNLHGSLQALALLPHLAVLSLKNNTLSDSLHLLNLSLWQPHLKILYLSENHLSGPFPQCILLLRHLHRLDLAGNLFIGSIPSNIGILLPRLLTLRLENNLINGEIPSSLGEVRGLIDLNVSCNRLFGEIPGNLSMFPPSSFIGNTGLCGKPLPGGGCLKEAMPDSGSSKKRRNCRWMVILFLIVILAVALALLLVAFLVFKKWRYRRREEGKGERGRGDAVIKGREERLVFFEGCKEFVMEDLMRGSAEMLGRGVVGSTYRVAIEGGGGGEGGVVVKRVRKERVGKERREWMEVEGLLREIGGWRHPNVVSLLAYYSSEDELLLVFEYVPRGSLHNLLHGQYYLLIMIAYMIFLFLLIYF